jgi:hypothetical protein
MMAGRFVVKDCAGQKLAYVYFEDEPGMLSSAELRMAGAGVIASGRCSQSVSQKWPWHCPDDGIAGRGMTEQTITTLSGSIGAGLRQGQAVPWLFDAAAAL